MLLGNMITADWVFGFMTQSLVFLAAGWILIKIFKRTSPPMISGLFLMLMVPLILLPLVSMLFKADQVPLYKLPISYIWRESPAVPSIRDYALDENGKTQVSSVDLKAGKSNAQPLSARTKDDAFNLLSVNPILLFLNAFGLIWLAGALFLLGRLFYGLAFLSGFRRSAQEIPEEISAEAFRMVRAAFPNTKLPGLYTSSAVNSPMAMGIFQPMIVLPQSLYQNLSPAELGSILVHETAHIHHRDQLFGILQRVFMALYWWNPMAYSLSASFSVAREHVSDNYAIQKTGARPYAKCLVALAQKTNLIARLPAAVGMATPYISLEERVKNIVSEERVMITKLKKPLVLLLALSALFLTIILGKYAWALMPEESTARVYPLPAGMRAYSMAVGKDRLYISGEEGPQRNPDRSVAIFSLKDFSLLKKFGQTGKGVGEFLFGPGDFNIVDGSLWFEDIGKILVFSGDGTFQREFRYPIKEIFLLGYPLLPVGGNYAAFPGKLKENGPLLYSGRLYDREFRLIKQFYEETPSVFPPPPPPPPPPGKTTEPKNENLVRTKEDYQVIPDCIDFAVAEDKIYAADTRQGFHISVFDSRGNPLYVIDKEYEKLQVPQDYYDGLMKRLEKQQAWLYGVANFKFREYYPAFMSFKIADNKIYVATYVEKENLHELIVMNLKGDILMRKFVFPLGPSSDRLYNNFFILRRTYDIRGDRIYYLARNETTGSSEVRIQDIK